MRWLVADLANIPLSDSTVDAILNVFTPANYDEFKRVLKPGGMLVKVIPAPQHMHELRELAGEQLVDAILNVFTPANYDEFKRVLKPGGMLVKVIPAPQHMHELRELAGEQLSEADFNVFTPANYDEFKRVLKPGGMLVKVIPAPQHMHELRELAGEQLSEADFVDHGVSEHLMRHMNVVSRPTTTNSNASSNRAECSSRSSPPRSICTSCANLQVSSYPRPISSTTACPST